MSFNFEGCFVIVLSCRPKTIREDPPVSPGQIRKGSRCPWRPQWPVSVVRTGQRGIKGPVQEKTAAGLPIIRTQVIWLRAHHFIHDYATQGTRYNCAVCLTGLWHYHLSVCFTYTTFSPLPLHLFFNLISSCSKLSPQQRWTERQTDR